MVASKKLSSQKKYELFQTLQKRFEKNIIWYKTKKSFRIFLNIFLLALGLLVVEETVYFLSLQ